MKKLISKNFVSKEEDDQELDEVCFLAHWLIIPWGHMHCRDSAPDKCKIVSKTVLNFLFWKFLSEVSRL